jgi:GT2 family glycosyltransferase
MENYIGKCLQSLLDQTISDFEVVIVDESSDGTESVIAQFSDKRIRYFRNRTRLGLVKSRNKSWELSKGKYVFFTDGDCIVSDDWIEQGLGVIEESDCAGVEGRTYYVSEEHSPTYSDHVIKNKGPGQFMTCNMAYRRNALEEVGGFDERYTLEDRILAMRIMRAGGKIVFNPNMKVYHQQVTEGVRRFFKQASMIDARPYLFREFGDREDMLWRIVYPKSLVVALFPPAALLSLLTNRYEKWDDFKLFPFVYFRALYQRFCLWRQCLRERVFLI